jgi:hypothetical protein
MVGPLLPVEVHVPQALAALLTSQGQPVPAPVTGWALIDTGATLSGVHEPTALQLGIATVGQIPSGTAAGQVMQNQYPVRFVFPGLGGVGFGVDVIRATGVNLAGSQWNGIPYQALIGRDALGACVLTYNGPGALYTLSW